jgi:fatty-acyl-CoA synthase
VFGPLFHAGPLMDLTFPLLMLGGRVALGASRNFDPATLRRTIAQTRGTVVPIDPTMIRRVLTLPDAAFVGLDSLRMITTGGEPVPLPVIHGVHERFPGVAFVGTYGSTEASPALLHLRAQDSPRMAGSVGMSSFSVEVRIAGEDGTPLPPMQVGEVLVRSPFVCRGYWQRPEATAEALRNGWWHTGDLAYRDEEGFIWIAGRRSDMIKSGGENIHPPEVEQVIAELDGVAEVAVIGVPDEDWGESVAEYIVSSPGARLDSGRVIAHCRMGLAGFKRPRHVRFIEALPRHTTNKVDKVRLRAIFAEGA